MVRRDLRRAASDWSWLALVGLIAFVWAAIQWGIAPRHENGAGVKPIASHGARAVTRPIETIRVGDRVLARNPEVTHAERAARVEPNWAEWVHVSLQLPLASPDQAQSAPSRFMKIELLRPEAWLLDRVGYVARMRDEAEDGDAAAVDTPRPTSTSSLPVRELFRESDRIAEWSREQNIELLEQCIDLELPEMGAVGRAVITDIQPCRQIAPGDGQVVTATFAHPPSTQVLDVRFFADSPGQLTSVADASGPPLGVTENHPFWSVDRQEFVPISHLAVGQRVVTYQGDIKRIASKLPRPGPETVYNLEVYGEHVYFVGEQGLLAHNSCAIGDLGEKGAKGWLERSGYTEIMQFQNPSGHGLDVVARHRDGTLTFFEVKTSTGGRAPKLSKAQANQAKFIRTKLQQAANAGPWWRSTPLAVREKADDVLEEITVTKKYRRYVIEITNATNSAEPTQFRIRPWSP